MKALFLWISICFYFITFISYRFPIKFIVRSEVTGLMTKKIYIYKNEFFFVMLYFLVIVGYLLIYEILGCWTFSKYDYLWIHRHFECVHELVVVRITKFHIELTHNSLKKATHFMKFTIIIIFFLVNILSFVLINWFICVFFPKLLSFWRLIKNYHINKILVYKNGSGNEDISKLRECPY